MQALVNSKKIKKSLLTLLIIIMTLVNISESAKSLEDYNYFINAVTNISTWFKDLTNTYNEFVDTEEKKQLHRSLKDLSKGLYQLEIARQEFINSLLVLDDETHPNDQDKIYFYNMKNQDFIKRMEDVESLLHNIGSDLREMGNEGIEVEEMINFGFNYHENGQNNQECIPSSYGNIQCLEYDKEYILEENERCKKALKNAQISLARFSKKLQESN